MRICAAQTKPVTGDIAANVRQHQKLIDLAVAHAADMVVFPELSLTGYEPTLARDLAPDPNDPRFDEFQTVSDAHGIVIGAGVPTRHEAGICISMILFQPRQPRSVYSKTFLHADEEPFFVPGNSSPHLRVGQTNIALAICYEISVPEHLKSALKLKADIYIASVAKSVDGIEKASTRLAEIARTSGIPVLMVNSVGTAGGGQCAGRSAAWNSRGELLGRLNDTHEGIVLLDTQTRELIVRAL